MAILEELAHWAEGLPAWQREALNRLHSSGALSADDFGDLYALLKAAHGIPDPQRRVAAAIRFGTPGEAGPDRDPPRLRAIKNLQHVNAIAPGQTLAINSTGLTVVYGANGSGKSGYARVLKKVCRARDTLEEIQPDARHPRENAGRPSAEFDVEIGGVVATVRWTAGAPPPAELADIAVFDSRCATAYVDNQGDFAYVPDGLQMLHSLGSTCGRLRQMLDDETRANAVDPNAFVQVGSERSAAGRYVRGLTAQSNLAELAQLCDLTEAEEARHGELTAALAERDPAQKAQDVRLRATRLRQLARRIGEQVPHFSAQRQQELREVRDRARDTRAVADALAKSFRENPELLTGTGGEVWRALFAAARTFAAEAHPGHAFPSQRCPLCQQTLNDEAQKRLQEFDEFVQGEAERAARDARNDAIASYRQLQGADATVGLDAPLEEELRSQGDALVAACSRLRDDLMTAKEQLLRAFDPNADWPKLPILNDPTAELQAAADRLEVEAEELARLADPEQRRQSEAARSELADRLALRAIRGTVEDHIRKLVHGSRLAACLRDVQTGGISKKATDITQTIATNRRSWRVATPRRNSQFTGDPWPSQRARPNVLCDGGVVWGVAYAGTVAGPGECVRS